MTNISVNHLLRTVGASLTNDTRSLTFSIATPARVFTFQDDEFGVAQTLFEQQVCELYEGVAVSTLTSRCRTVDTVRALCERHALEGERVHQVIVRKSRELLLAYSNQGEPTIGTFMDAIAGRQFDKYQLGDDLNAELQYLLARYPEGDEVDGIFYVSRSSLDFGEVLRAIQECYERSAIEGFELGELVIAENGPALDSLGQFIFDNFERNFNLMDQEEKRDLFWGDFSVDDFTKGKRMKFASFYPTASMLATAFITKALFNFRADGLLTTVEDEKALMFVARQLLRLRGSFLVDRVAGTICKGVKRNDE